MGINVYKGKKCEYYVIFLCIKVYYDVQYCENPYRCILCDTSFINRTDLETHQRMHTGEKLFQCRNCDITVYINSDFISHIRTHTSALSFLLSVSDVCLNDKILLYICYRTHTEEKPYQCIIYVIPI